MPYLCNEQSFIIYQTHNQTTTTPLWILSGTTKVSQTRKGIPKPIWISWSKRHWVAVVSARPYANLHLAPDRQPHQHPTTHNQTLDKMYIHISQHKYTEMMSKPFSTQ